MLLSIALIVVLAILIIQLITIKYEMTSEYFVRSRHTGEDWFIHHDEKIALSDGRFLYLKKTQPDLDLWDFLPQPLAAAFGVLSPALMYVGFSLFGLNNLGLRFFNLIINTLTNTLIVFTAFSLLSPILAFILCLLLMLNWNYFILTRHFVLENILSLYLAGIFYIYVCHQSFFASNIFLLALLSSSVILTKINFPAYILVLFLPLSFAINGMVGMITVTIGFVMGLCLFEFLQALILAKYGIAKWRYSNLFVALKVHAGIQKSMGVRLRPMGLRVFCSVLNLFVEWFGLRRTIINLSKGCGKGLLLIAIPVIVTLFIFAFDISKPLFILVSFISLYILSLAPMHFYLKRVVSIFPLLLLVVALLLQSVINQAPQMSLIIQIGLIGLCGLVLWRQLLIAFEGYPKRTNSIETFSKYIEELLPEARSIIYSHCYGFRFLWMQKAHRFRFADDNAMNNQEIIDWAIKEGGRYVIITTGGSKVAEYALPLIKPINVLSTTNSDSDIPEGLVICELAT